jgi:hypothetical protein
MAATYRAVATGVAFNAAARSLLKVFNASGSGVVLRVYRIWVLNNQTTAVTGVVPRIDVVRVTTNPSGGSANTPIKHDTNSANLPAQVTAATLDSTVTVANTFRRILWSSDEPAVGAATVDELEMVVPLNLLWDGGYGDSNVEPIVCREGEGVSVYCPGIASAAGIVDIIIEFTST